MFTELLTRLKPKILSQEGTAVMMVISIIAILSIMAAGMSTIIVNEMQMIVQYQNRTRAYYVAQAGIAHGLWRINNEGTGTFEVNGSVPLGGQNYPYTVRYNSNTQKLASEATVGSATRQISVKITRQSGTFIEEFDDNESRAGGSAIWDTTLGQLYENFSSTWNSRGTGCSGTTYYGAFFLDENTAWVVGAGGTILKSTNGGTNFSSQPSGVTTNLNDVFFIDATTGWVVGNSGTILKTTNGGNSWVSKSSGTTSNFYDVHFVDANNGWAAGGGGIFKTADGGETWIQKLTVYITDLDFIDTQTGWAIQRYGQVYKTTNGNDWIGGGQTVVSSYGYEPNLDFIGAQTGWAAGGSAYGIAKTVDGGATWKYQPNTSAAYDIYFSDAYTGWIIRYTSVFKTINGGVSWTWESGSSGTYCSGNYPKLKALAFFEAKRGLAVGERGAIVRMSGFYPSPQDAYSYPIDTVATNISQATLTPYYEDLPSGLTVEYRMASSEISWTSYQVLGHGQRGTFTLSPAGSDLRWYARLNSLSGSKTPRIDRLEIEYDTGYILDYSTWRSN